MLLLVGPLPKGQCAKIFSTNGCELCLNIFDSSNALEMHKDSCRMTPALSPVSEGNKQTWD